MAYIGRPASAEVSVTGSTDTFTGDGGVTFNLSRTVKDSNPSLLEVFVSNVQQQPTVTYSVTANVLTFTTAPGVGEPIYVTYRDYPVAPIFTVPDASITTAKIQDGAITADKIADGTIIPADISDGAVTTAKLDANAVVEAKIADGAVTPNKISGEVPVTKGGTGAASLTANAVLLGNGTSAVATVSAGDSGNVLTSDGSIWLSKAISAGGNLAVSVFTSPGTWDADAKIAAGLKAVKVSVVGGGGGAGVIATATVNAGTSSFGAFCSATGGNYAAVGGSVGGAGSGGDINVSGGRGTFYTADFATYYSVSGGAGALGLGGGVGGAAPADGLNYGGGAGGHPTSSIYVGGGGGGAIKYISAPDIPGPVAVTVGVGGTGNSPAPQIPNRKTGGSGIVVVEEFY